MHYEDIKAMQEEVLLEQKELKITKECYALTKNITKLLRKKYEKKTSWKSGFIFHKEFSVTIFEPKFFATWNNEIKPLISKQMVLIQELLKEEYMNEKLDIDLERAL
jgi:hypothetical protein